MSRTLSLTFRKSINDEISPEAIVTLLELQHPDIPGIARLSSDPTQRVTDVPWRYGTISGGNTYLFCPMIITQPDDIDERAPTSVLQIAQVDRQLTVLARSVITSGTCNMKQVLASAPNTVEYTWPTFDIRSFSLVASMLSLEFGNDALDREPFPAYKITPSGFPGGFN